MSKCIFVTYMCRHLVFFFLGLVFISQSVQAQVNDDFSDGNFTASPAWTGDTASWRVVSQQLNSNALATTTQTYIATANTWAVTAQWEFLVNLKFATSSANYADIFLISDSLTLSGQNSGYFVRVGNTLDEICLYRKTGSTSVKIIDGIDSRVSGSTNNLFKIKVTRSGTCEFKLYDDSTGTGNNYYLEGSVTDAKFLNGGFFGFLLKYSSANIQKFFFDDIAIGPLKSDTEAIKIDSVWAADSITCIIQCSEAVLDADATNTMNYLLNGTQQPATAQRLNTDFSQIRLTFATPFTANTLLPLQVSGLRDLVLNSQKTPAVKLFTYIRNAFGDLVINEIFADPSPVIGLPAFEYVELWNVSGKDLNLLNYSFTDGSSTAVLPSTILKKDSFMILCSTSAQLAWSAYGNALGVSNFPSLNNDADDLRLYDDKNRLLDEKNYTLAWYRDPMKSDGGWSLEMIHPKLQCKRNYNWKASENAGGGTPGQMNSVYNAFADTLSPRIIAFSRMTDSSLLIVFNDAMDSASIQAMLLSVSGMTVKSIVSANRASDSVWVTLTTPFFNQTNYSVQISAARNCNGNSMIPFFTSFYYEIPKPARMGDIVISEILADPDPVTALGNSEFIELNNRSGYAINLKGMQITDGTSIATLPEFILFRDSFLILTTTSGQSWFSSHGITSRALSGFPSLDNTSDQILLKDSAGHLIHYMSYTMNDYTDPVKAAGGWSLELKDQSLPCLVTGNWNFSTDASGGTPGRKNAVTGKITSSSPITLSRISTLDPLHILLAFSEPVDSAFPVSSLEFTPALKGGYKLSYYKGAPTQIFITLTAPLDSGVIYTLKVKDVTNCTAKKMGAATLRFGLPSAPGVHDLVINEILFDAWPYGSEFTELYNRSEKVIELSGVAMGNRLAGGTLHHVIPLASKPTQLLPGDYVVFCENSDDVIHRYAPVSLHGEIIPVANWSSFDDDSGALFIQTISSGLLLDSIGFSKTMHHAFLSNPEGVSLERVDYDADGKNLFNWQSAASNVRYGTPGYLNSKFSKNVSSGDFVDIPEAYLTPDNDGTHDALEIRVHLPPDQYTLTITVYAASGQRIRRLVTNEIAGTDALYLWDGSNDAGEISGVGHYIVQVEAVSSTLQTRSTRRVVDLLLR